MTDCLKTQLKEAVQNDNLDFLGEMKVYITKKGSNKPTIQLKPVNVQNPVTIRPISGSFSIDGIIYTTKTSITVNKNIVSESDNLVLSISKYYIKEITPISVLQNEVAFSLDDLKYSMIEGAIWNSFDVTGNIESFPKNQCAVVNILNTSIIGDIKDLDILGCTMFSPNDKMTGSMSDYGKVNISEYLNLASATVTGSVEDFVAQKAASGELRINQLLRKATFGGNIYTVDMCWLEWADNKIAVYTGANTKAECTTVYCKGYTQQEAESAFSGKTIVRVDA